MKGLRLNGRKVKMMGGPWVMLAMGVISLATLVFSLVRRAGKKAGR